MKEKGKEARLAEERLRLQYNSRIILVWQVFKLMSSSLQANSFKPGGGAHISQHQSSREPGHCLERSKGSVPGHERRDRLEASAVTISPLCFLQQEILVVSLNGHYSQDIGKNAGF